MFAIETKKISSSAGVNVGTEVVLKGELIYGTPVKEFEKLKEFLTKLESLAVSDIIAINLLQLDRWDSLGVAQTLAPIIKINERLLAKGRKPIGLIGVKSKDTYLAVKDKYPELYNTTTLSWYDTLGQFLADVGVS